MNIRLIARLRGSIGVLAFDHTFLIDSEEFLDLAVEIAEKCNAELTLTRPDRVVSLSI